MLLDFSYGLYQCICIILHTLICQPRGQNGAKGHVGHVYHMTACMLTQLFCSKHKTKVTLFKWSLCAITLTVSDGM